LFGDWRQHSIKWKRKSISLQMDAYLKFKRLKIKKKCHLSKSDKNINYNPFLLKQMYIISTHLLFRLFSFSHFYMRYEGSSLPLFKSLSYTLGDYSAKSVGIFICAMANVLKLKKTVTYPNRIKISITIHLY
jgi:hypothetical protein